MPELSVSLMDIVFLLGNIGAEKAEAVKPSESFPVFFFLHLLSTGFRRNRGNKKVVGRCLYELLWSGFTCAVPLDALIQGIVRRIRG